MKNKIAGLIVALFAMLAFQSAKAQCTINNMLGCQVKVVITFYNSGTPACSGFSMPVPPGVTTIPGCGTCPGLYQLMVTVTDAAGIPLSPQIAADWASILFPGQSTASPATSCATGTAINIWYNSSTNEFEIY